MQQFGIKCPRLVVEEAEHADDTILHSERDVEEIADLGSSNWSISLEVSEFIGSIQVRSGNQFVSGQLWKADDAGSPRNPLEHGSQKGLTQGIAGDNRKFKRLASEQNRTGSEAIQFLQGSQ